MSTKYTLTGSDKPSTDELFLLESSGELSLEYYSAIYDDSLQILEDASPEEMMKVMLEGIKICSYQMASEDFESIIEQNFENYSF